MRPRLALALSAAALAVAGLGVSTAVGSADPQSTQGGAQKPEEPVVNGGARYWIAFDPHTVSANSGGAEALRVVLLANTSTATSSVTVTYQPIGLPRISICTRTLSPGGVDRCHTEGRTRDGFQGGYLQVRASQPVLVGGWIDVPMREWEQVGVSSSDIRVIGKRGFVQRLPFAWQQGCPPRSGSGCPTRRLPAVASPNGEVQTVTSP